MTHTGKTQMMRTTLKRAFYLMMGTGLILTGCNTKSGSAANQTAIAANETAAKTTVAETTAAETTAAVKDITWAASPSLEADEIILIDPYTYQTHKIYATDVSGAITSDDYHNLYLIEQGETASVVRLDGAAVVETLALEGDLRWCSLCGIADSRYEYKYGPLDFEAYTHGGHGGSNDGVGLSIYDSGTGTFYPNELTLEPDTSYIFTYSNAVADTDMALIGMEADGSEKGFCVIRNDQCISDLFKDAKEPSDIQRAKGYEVLPLLVSEDTLTPVLQMDDTWTYVDAQGKTHGSYEDARSYHGDYAAVKVDGSWGLINKAGDTVVDFLFKDLTSVENGYAYAQDPETDLWGLIAVQ